MKTKIDERKTAKSIAIIFLLALSISSVILWSPKGDLNTQFLVQTLKISGLAICAVVVYLVMTHEDKSKTATPWSNTIGIITSLLFDLFLMFGTISVLGQFAGLEVNKVFILALFATSIYLLVEKVFFKNLKFSLCMMLPVFILAIVGDASYKWHALVLLVGLVSNLLFGDYIAEITFACLQKFGKLFEGKKDGKRKKKGKKKKRKVKRKKTKKKK